MRSSLWKPKLIDNLFPIHCCEVSFLLKNARYDSNVVVLPRYLPWFWLAPQILQIEKWDIEFNSLPDVTYLESDTCNAST